MTLRTYATMSILNSVPLVQIVDVLYKILLYLISSIKITYPGQLLLSLNTNLTSSTFSLCRIQLTKQFTQTDGHIAQTLHEFWIRG